LRVRQHAAEVDLDRAIPGRQRAIRSVPITRLVKRVAELAGEDPA
jgi:hypothetical protein